MCVRERAINCDHLAKDCKQSSARKRSLEWALHVRDVQSEWIKNGSKRITKQKTHTLKRHTKSRAHLAKRLQKYVSVSLCFYFSFF